MNVIAVLVAHRDLRAQTVDAPHATIRIGETARSVVEPGAAFTLPIIVEPSPTLVGALSYAAVVVTPTAGLVIDSITPGPTVTIGVSRDWFPPGVYVTTTSVGSSGAFSLGTIWAHAPATSGGATLALSRATYSTVPFASSGVSGEARSHDVCVRRRGVWGDVTDDDLADIIDAQQLARYSAGFPIQNLSLVEARGDVTADGAVNVIDAQQVARHSIGLISAPRIAQAVWTVPTIASLLIEQPGNLAMPLGTGMILHAQAYDAGGAIQTGCVAPATWSSAAPGIVVADSAGRVLALASGTTTVVASVAGVERSIRLASGTAMPFLLQVVSGSRQVAPMLSTLPTVQLRLVDLNGNPQKTVTVRYRVVAGGGVIGGNGFGEGFALSDTSGLVAITDWRLGTTSPDQRLVAQVPMPVYQPGFLTDTVTILATATGSPVPLTVRSLTVGSYHACAVTTVAEPMCWGSDTDGEIGDGTVTTRRVFPAVVAGSIPFTELAPGDRFSCGTTTSVTYCWGANSAGLGLASGATSSSRPSLVSTTVPLHGLTSGGAYHVCGLSSDGQAYCWGDNSRGQLGDGTTSNHPLPAAVASPEPFTRLVAGGLHTCGLTAHGHVFCWGWNAYGQLGDGTTTDHPVPTAVASDSLFIDLSAGFEHACALARSGRALCWGDPASGATGTLAYEGRRLGPLALPGDRVFTVLASGGKFSCGLSEGAAYCWGTLGPLGYAPGFTRYGENGAFSALSAGYQNVCGILAATGGVMCWGGNQYGEAGMGFNSMLVSQPSAVLRRIDP